MKKIKILLKDHQSIRQPQTRSLCSHNVYKISYLTHVSNASLSKNVSHNNSGKKFVKIKVQTNANAVHDQVEREIDFYEISFNHS